MRTFKRLTYNERLQIESLYNINTKISTIAKYLGHHISTIYREIQRGLYDHLNHDYTYTKKYSSDKAQRYIDYANSSKGVQLKIGNDYDFVEYVEKMILKKYSPEALLAEIHRKKLTFKTKVCVSTIYNYIDKGIFMNISTKDLTRQGKMKGKPRQERKAKRAPAGQSIEKRAQHINDRSEFGHWEMDTVIGQKTRGQILLVLTERKTRYQLIFKMKDKTAKSTVQAINNLECKFKSKFTKIFKTITVDNGTEFSACFDLEQSCIRAHQQRTTMFYCHPYSSWERGSNENQNAFIRRFIPKGTRIEKYTKAEIEQITTFINDYPRRMFNYSTSQELFAQECSNL